MAHQRAQVGKDDGGGAMDGELPTLSISLTGVALNCGKILAPPLPGVTRPVVSRVSRRCPAKTIVDKACCLKRSWTIGCGLVPQQRQVM